MSLKNLTCATAILALAASSAMAQTISIDLVRSGGFAVLDANGDWQWEVSVTTAGGGATAAEVSYNVTGGGSPVTGAVAGGGVWDTDNPGAIPGGLNAALNAAVLADQAANAALVTDPFNSPDGVVSAADGVYIALGSSVAASGTTLLATFTTEGPSTVGSLTTEVTSLGAYSGLNIDGGTIQGGALYNVAQGAVNNLSAGATITKTAVAGDTDMDGDVDLNDAGALIGNLNSVSGNIWHDGDMDRDGDVDLNDAGVLIGALGSSGTAPGVVAPEPSSAALITLGLGLLCGRRRR